MTFTLFGAMVGGMIVAYIGTLTGGIAGVMTSWSLRKCNVSSISPLGGTFCGGVIGAVGLGLYVDKDTAVLWGLHGAWIGALSMLVGLVSLFGLIFLAARLQPKKATA